MQILITGITGRIGANLAAHLCRTGHRVRGLVWPRDPRVDKLGHLDLELHEGSIVDPGVAAALVDGVDVIYNLAAAFQGGGPFTAQEYFEINVGGLFNMLEAAAQQPDLRRFIFASTDAVLEKYVWGQDEILREEEQPRQPGDWYSLSKSVGEEMCGGYVRMGAVPAVILRFPWVMGIGEILDFPQFYLSKCWQQYGLEWEESERLVILRDAAGRSYRKHVADVRDIVSGLVSALDAEQLVGATIQLAGPRAFTWEEAVPHLSRHLGIPYVDATVTQGPPSFYEHDLTRARALLGWEPRFDILAMIDDAMAFRKGEDLGVLPF